MQLIAFSFSEILRLRILRSLVALLSVKLLTLGIIQVNLILHSLTRNIVSIGMTKQAVV